MESSTTITQQLGDAHAQQLVRAHNNIVRDALKAHGGSEIKHTGDGIMATFNSAAGAIECAISIQRGCDTHAVEHPTAPLRMRIGLNAGEPVAEERDLFGAAVQLANRVCTSAGPGQILVSDVVRQLSTGKRFLWSDMGHVPLRGFEDPVRLFEVKWRS
jgi:class 3 adenylate cyclase